jgi:hypothetical protein
MQTVIRHDFYIYTTWVQEVCKRKMKKSWKMDNFLWEKFLK